VDEDIRRVVVVGGGVAALRAGEKLREDGYEGEIVQISDEHERPYDRPPLSKDVLTGRRDPASVSYRTEQELRELGIEARLGAPAQKLLLERCSVVAGGETIAFDRLLIATGARARDIPRRADLEGVYRLRTLDDARQLRQALDQGPRVVVIGAGLIGSEVASSARSLGLDVTVVEAASSPLTRVLGVRTGAICGDLHAEHGTRLLCGVAVANIRGSRRVESVDLSDGTRLPADVLVVGVGATPNTAWLEGSGLTLNDGVVCDEHLNAGHPRVFAAGDVARWRDPALGLDLRCEQWTNAVEQARHAAANLLAPVGQRQPFAGSNYFWSDQYGHRLQLVGSIRGATGTSVIWGDVTARRFLSIYHDGQKILGAFGMDASRLVMRAKSLMQAGVGLDAAREQLGDP
jgi:NADPH-dependent 2,4-dienoyl-CoA reductase/sulfur reductase-like enzyme